MSLQQPVRINESLLGNSESMDLCVLGSETNQNLESERTGSEVFEEAKGAENGDVADRVKTSPVEKDDNTDFLNGDDDIKKRDGNMLNLAPLSNSVDGEKMKKGLSTTTDELQQYFSSQIH